MKVKIDLGEVNMPDFMIVGAGKSGTTSLHSYLDEHPDVFMPWHKETWFFHLIDNPNKAILKRVPYLPTNFLSYLGLYAGAKPNQICGESTPSYLYYHKLAIPNIKKFHPEWRKLKIIIILREPIEKVISHYKFVHTLRLDPENLNFENSLIKEKQRLTENKELGDLFYVDNTLYYEQVKNYISNFENVKIFLYEQLKNDTQKLIKELYSFIGVDSNFIPTTLNEIHNKSNRKMVPRNSFANGSIKILERVKRFTPPLVNTRLRKMFLKEEVIRQEDINFLKDQFREDVKKLQSIVDKDLSHWIAKYE